MPLSRNERVKQKRKILAQKVGERIMGLRKREDLTRDDLARILGIYSTTLRRYEVEKRMVPADIGMLIAQHFDMTLDEFYS